MPENTPHPDSLAASVTPAGPRDHAERIASLTHRIQQFQTAIQGLEVTRAELQRRRRGATDSVMLELDDRLAVHLHALDCLKRGLALTELELKRIANTYPALNGADRNERSADPAR